MVNAVNSISQKAAGAIDATLKNPSILNVEFCIVDKILPKSQKVDWLNIDKILKPEINNSGLENIRNKKIYNYAPGTVKKIRDGKIKKEQEHVSKPISSRTAFNTEQLKASEVKEKDIPKYLTYDGHVTNDGKKILKEHGKSWK